jgi:hypothetical protein
MRIQALLITGLLLLAAPSRAEEFWSHKDWHVSFDNTRCRMATGGDGDDTFSLEFSPGGLDAAATYEPLMIRGYPTAIAPNDELELVIDGKSHFVSDELLVFDGQNQWGDHFIAASISSGSVPVLMVALGVAVQQRTTARSATRLSPRPAPSRPVSP